MRRCCALVSMRATSRERRVKENRRVLELVQEGKVNTHKADYLKHQKMVSRAGSTTKALNQTAGIGLVVGLAMVAAFAFVNM